MKLGKRSTITLVAIILLGAGAIAAGAASLVGPQPGPPTPVTDPYRIVPLAELDPADRAYLEDQISPQESTGILARPESELPPDDDVVIQHVEPLDELTPRLTFAPLVADVSGYELVGALEAPTESVGGLPAGPQRLTALQLVYRSNDSDNVVLVSQEDLAASNTTVTVAQEQLTTTVGSYPATQRTLEGESSGRRYTEVTWFDGTLHFVVGGYAEPDDVLAFAKDFAG